MYQKNQNKHIQDNNLLGASSSTTTLACSFSCYLPAFLFPTSSSFFKTKPYIENPQWSPFGLFQISLKEGVSLGLYLRKLPPLSCAPISCKERAVSRCLSIDLVVPICRGKTNCQKKGNIDYSRKHGRGSLARIG